MVFSVGSMHAEFKQTSTSAKVYIGLATSFSCCAGDYCMVRAMHSLSRGIRLHVRMHVKLQG